MNVQRIFFWIRVGAGVILGVLDWLEASRESEENDGGEDGNAWPEFKPERIQLWLRILARAAVETLDEAGVPPDGGEEHEDFGPEFKPERIQFWIELFARFVLAVIEVREETGKSGERSGKPDPREVGW